ncbi:MAG: putative ABC transporter permease [Bulleidia sp.]
MYLSASETVIVFFVFSFFGWCMEVILKAIQLHRYVNRGFLIGPYCPIYGFGVVFIITIINFLLPFPYRMVQVFAAGLLICGILEYTVSWFLEKRYHLRWWDYSDKPCNIHGRVWAGNLILFGLGSVVIVEAGYPLCRFLLDLMKEPVKWILSAVITAFMSADTLISRAAMQEIRSEVEDSISDETENIREHIRLVLAEHSLPVRHLLKTYPAMHVSRDYLKQKLQEARTDFLEKAEKIEERLENNPQAQQFRHRAQDLGAKFRNTDHGTNSSKK